MHKPPKLLCLPVALLLLAADPPKPAPDADEEEASEEQSEDEKTRKEPPDDEEEGTAQAPGQVHTVTKGDTLWDLSQQYLGSPWYWPKVWSYNPEIANPHWIYPGNQVRFFPGGEEAPARVEVASGETSEAPSGPDVLPTEEQTPIQVVGKIGFHQGKSFRIAPHGFVTQREVEESGVISGSPAESLMLSYPDTVYLSFRNRGSVKLGDRYVIFRTVSQVRHPVNQKSYGYLTHVIGTVRITGLSKNYVVGQINPDTWDEVHRGDLIGPAEEKTVATIVAKPNAQKLNGFVIGTLIPFLTLHAEHSLIVVDKGSSDGVLKGNTFTVVRQQDPAVNVQAFIYPSKGQDFRLPEESVATCIVVEPKEHASLCLINRSMRDIVYGDRVVMRPEDSSAPTASLQSGGLPLTHLSR